jgi:ribose-phosphate pyrophosphokinase
MLICAGSSNAPLAGDIAKILNVPFVDRSISTFPNGEKRILLTTSVRHEDVVIVQSFSQPVDDNIIELALLVDAAKRAGSNSITVVIPWLGYSLQNDVFRVGESLAVKVIADMLSAPIDKFVFVDLHNDEIVGFVTKLAANLSMIDTFAEEAKGDVVVSPDHGGSKRAKQFAAALNLPHVELEKTRDRATGIITMGGEPVDVEGKRCLLIDDVINTGSTAMAAAESLKEQGARSVTVYATHIVTTEKHVAALEKSAIDHIIVSNTVHNAALKGAKKFHVVSAGEQIAAALRA